MSYESHEVPLVGIILSEEAQKVYEIYNKYEPYLQLATPEEKKLLKKYGFQVESPTNKIIIK